MKTYILTSSIFFLLGLKMTHHIEQTQKLEADTAKITIINEEQKTTEVQYKTKQFTEPDQHVKPIEPGSGSSQLIAPLSAHPIDKID